MGNFFLLSYYYLAINNLLDVDDRTEYNVKELDLFGSLGDNGKVYTTKDDIKLQYMRYRY